MALAEDQISVSSGTTEYHVDSEHGGIRMATMGLFIVMFFVGFFLTNALISDAGINLLSVLVGILLATVVTMVGERQLKRVWKSGRMVVIDEHSVQIIKNGTQELKVTREDGVNAILWSFKINRRSRVPKGYSMFACALEREDERHLTAYTFMSPAQTSAFEAAGRFKPIQSRKEQQKNQANNALREELRAAGEQRRLREAEDYRWMNGAEMSADDFVAYFARLEAQFSEWMPLR
ncbi:hypothetical protein FBR02_00245 [Anaerolineae bacterium CFX9]|nr:hypothetical protein [Anaerolineae bacterium CFX9]